MGQEKIIHQLPNLDSTKSSATNDIPTKFIKITTRVIAPILTKLYNICISEGVFPNFLKLSQITPIYEKFLKILCLITVKYPCYLRLEKFLRKRVYSQFIV